MAGLQFFALAANSDAALTLGERFKEAAKKGFAGFCRESVDEDGNVYGVCCGSAYSFRADYYKYELPWLKNDTHGTGIVLLAGVEVSKL